MKGSRRVSVSENSRNGATRRLGRARRKPRLGVTGGHWASDGILVLEAYCPGPLAGLRGLGSFSASQFAPASVQLIFSPLFQPFLFHLPPWWLRQSLNVPAKGVILIRCDFK